MSIMYDNYLSVHKANVKNAAVWILNKIPIDKLHSIFSEINSNELLKQIESHDESKYSTKEYNAYDKYFYSERTSEVKEDFDKAWLHHIHKNPHHWQYWVLIDDDAIYYEPGSIDIKCIDIPDNYILEMISDWWSFSWKKYSETHAKESLYEILNWYEEHEDKIAMTTKTKKKVEDILKLIEDTLDSSDALIEYVLVHNHPDVADL